MRSRWQVDVLSSYRIKADPRLKKSSFRLFLLHTGYGRNNLSNFHSASVRESRVRNVVLRVYWDSEGAINVEQFYRRFRSLCLVCKLRNKGGYERFIAPAGSEHVGSQFDIHVYDTWAGRDTRYLADLRRNHRIAWFTQPHKKWGWGRYAMEFPCGAHILYVSWWGMQDRIIITCN